MTSIELGRFKQNLKAKHAELSGGLGRRDGIAIERTPDTLDEIQFAAARELMTRNLERETGVLRDVRAALDRIAEGTYGSCLECDEEISPKRLTAIPWATLCISCQEHVDRTSMGTRSQGSYLADAA